ncbi:MAG: polysaccharide biosynthesis C-terminal domain-containing protein [Bacteroidales bacterium]|nr:polysaccharide biosynthesis C-terminal domain-containing protein [Bacteroidales bacterium]
MKSKAYSIRMHRNTSLTDSSIKSTLIAAVLTSLAPVIASLVDGIFASNLISQDAFSAICLVVPLARIITVMILVCHMGANILAARQLGKREIRTAQSYFSVALWSSLAIGLLAFGIIFADIQHIGPLLTHSPILLPMVEDYLRIMAINFPVVAIASTLNFFISGEGYPQRTSRIVLISSISNILFDYLFIAVLGMGITGAAWGTVISSLLNVFLHLPFLFSGKSSYRIVRTAHETLPLLKDSVIQGFAFNIINITLNVFLMLANGLMEKQLGPDNFYQWAICLQMQMFMICICSGSVAGSIYLGNTLLGEGDHSGVRTVVNRLLQMHVIVYLSLVILMTAAPSIFTSIFGVRGAELSTACRFPFFCFSLYFMGYCFVCAYTNIFQMMGYVREKIIFIIGFSLVVFIFIWLGSLIHVTWMWAGFPIGALIVVASSMLFAYREHCKNRGLTRFTLQQTRPTNVNMDCSVPYQKSALDILCNKIKQFSYLSEMPEDKTCELVEYCYRLMTYVIEAPHNPSLKYFDFKMIYDTDTKRPTLLAVLKTAGKPMNPTKEVPSPTSIQAKIDYRYGYGLNITLLRWEI